MLRPQQRAVLWMVACGLCFTVMGAIVKHLSLQGLPVSVTALARMVFGLMFMLPWLIATGGRGILTRRLWGHGIRAVCGAVSLLFYMAAIAHLALADAVALSFTTPLWSIPVAVLLLREPVRLRRWTATAIGFAGVLVLVRPGYDFDPYMLVALASALITSFSQAATRQLSATEPGQRIVFYFALFGILFTLPAAIFWWQTPTTEQWLWLIAIGLIAYAGLSCSAQAISQAEVTVVAPVDYLRLPIAAAIGLLLFGEATVIWTFVGTAIIAGSTIYIMLCEATLKETRR